MAKSTRKSDPRLEVLEESPGYTDLIITGSKLPTYKQALFCYLSKVTELRRNDPTKNCKLAYPAAQYVVQQILPHYQKAHVPVISEIKMAQKVMSFHGEYLKCMKIPKAKREGNVKISNFKNNLKKTMPFFPCDFESIMIASKKGKSDTEKEKIDEDIKFVLNMLETRTFTYSSADNICTQKESDRIQRAAEAEMKREKEKKRRDEAEETCSPDPDEHEQQDDPDGRCDDEEVDQQKPSKSHKRQMKIGTSAFIPHDILKRPKVVSIAARLNITPAKQAAYTAALIEEAGGDPSCISSSYATTDKARRVVSGEVASNIKTEWEAPNAATLHWDGKQVNSLDNQMKIERLPVLVGNKHDTKLLGVAKYLPGTDEKSGDIIASKTANLLDSWNCQESIANMCFDTTASNTGHVTAACVAIQAKLGRALLWCACRHQVGEVILTHAFDRLNIA